MSDLEMLDPIALAAELRDAAAFERAVLDRLACDVGCDIAFFASLDATPTTIGLDAGELRRALDERRYESELWPTLTRKTGALSL